MGIEGGIFWTVLAGRAVKEAKDGTLKRSQRYKVAKMLEAETDKKEEENK